MFCAVTVSDYSAVLYIWKLLREYILNVHNNKNKSGNCVRWRKRQLTLLWQSFCYIYVYQSITWQPLNLHNLVSQLHLNKTGGEGEVSIMRRPREPQQSIVELLKTQDEKQFYKQLGEKNTLLTREK